MSYPPCLPHLPHNICLPAALLKARGHLGKVPVFSSDSQSPDPISHPRGTAIQPGRSVYLPVPGSFTPLCPCTGCSRRLGSPFSYGVSPSMQEEITGGGSQRHH